MRLHAASLGEAVPRQMTLSKRISWSIAVASGFVAESIANALRLIFENTMDELPWGQIQDLTTAQVAASKLGGGIEAHHAVVHEGSR